MNSLTVGMTTITLPDDLLWADELSWSTVAQSVKRSVDGAAIVQESIKQSGRTVTVKSPTEGGWISRSTVQAIIAAAESRPTVTLSLAGYSNMTVKFRFDGGSCLDVEPAFTQSLPPSGDQFYSIEALKFIEL
jgi:hypothetical protein